MTRYIYVYREKETGRAVYVGSAFDVEQRDRQHCNPRGELPFDREVMRRGRDTFTLETVETLTAESVVDALAAGVPRENYWMDVLNTFRTEHGFNFKRAAVVFDSEESRDAMRSALSTAAQKREGRPEVKAQRSAAMKAAHAKPEVKARHSAGCKAGHSTPESRARQAEAARVAWANPNVRACRVAASKAAHSTPEARARKAEAAKVAWANSDVRARMVTASKAAQATPEARARLAAQAKEQHALVRRAREMRLLPWPVAVLREHLVTRI